VSRPYWILDTGALLAYANGVERVGELLADVTDLDGTVETSLVCVLEAYGAVTRTQHHLLRLLRGHPTVRTVVPSFELRGTDECPTIGALGQHTGRLGAGHTAYLALRSAAGVVTSRADQFRTLLGDEWAIVAV
jgi:hypothetical protein